ncbi:MAG: DUF1592 domain-containing protein [Rhodospirillaceae bacterium]
MAAFALVSCSAPSGQDQAAAPAGQSAVAAPADAKGVPQRVRLMTQEQYSNSLAYIFGPDLRVDTRFAPMRRTEGLLANGAAFAGVTAAQLEQYQRTASLVSNAVVDAEHRDFLIPCKPKDEKAADAACATKFLQSTGRLLYRKPLPKEKVTAVVAEANAGAEKLKDFYAGLAAALEGMLLSPEVLFITDTYEPDPKNKGKFRLDGYSLAHRLSFFLWNAAPDDTMIKAAENGSILTPKGRAEIVEMMLASPRLETGMRAFFDDMMAFDDFNNLAKDAAIYPAFTGVTVQDAREQTLRTIVDHLITKKGDYRDLYTTRSTFMSQALAAIYGVSATPGWTPYEFPENSGRAGIATHVSFLSVHSHPGRSSPTLRGKALRELLLCQPVPRPPANVDFSALENPKSEHRTQRDRVNFHLENPVCAGCHKITDPMGLALEQFDGAGVYRVTERGTPIDPSGTLDGKNFKDAVGLAQALRDHPALTSCLVRRVYSYGTGGPTTREDAPVLTYLNQRFQEQGYRLPDLLRTITLSPTFSEVIPPAAGEKAPAEKTASAEQSIAAKAN